MRFSITDFSSGINAKIDGNFSRWKHAQSGYNFEYSDGSLKSGCPFETFKGVYLTGNPIIDSLVDAQIGLENGHVFYYKKYGIDGVSREDKLIIFDENLHAYYINLFAATTVCTPLNITFSSKPCAVNYRLNSEDVIIFTSPTDNMVVWDGVNSPQEILTAPKITSMSVHYERLFATTANKPTELWFSDDLDPTNWNINLSDAGFIQMVDDRGELKKVISYNDYLYIFREFGISRLSASGNQENFYLSHLFVNSGKIYENTAQLCGDRIIFVASNGIYMFDGMDTSPILTNLKPLFTVNSKSSSAYFDGKYYLSCSMNFFGDGFYDDNEVENNAILVVDVTTMQYEIIRGIVAEDMTIVTCPEINTIVFLNRYNTQGLIVPTKKTTNIMNRAICRWVYGFTDFGITKHKKVIRNIGGFVNYGKFKLIIYNEKNEKLIKEIFAGSNSIPTNFEGDKFSLRIISENPSGADNNASLSSLYFDIY